MAQLLLAVFSHQGHAEDAHEDLTDAGFDAKDISIVMKDGKNTQRIHQPSSAKGVVSGAVTGSAVGGLTGLLIGIGAITIPGIGGLLIGGPLAAALGLTGAAASTVSGLATGALAGGLIGGLMDLGLAEEDARVYEQRIKEGGILIAVPTTAENDKEARMILEDNNAEQIRTVVTDGRHEKNYIRI